MKTLWTLAGTPPSFVIRFFLLLDFHTVPTFVASLSASLTGNGFALAAFAANFYSSRFFCLCIELIFFDNLGLRVTSLPSMSTTVFGGVLLPLDFED